MFLLKKIALLSFFLIFVFSGCRKNKRIHTTICTSEDDNGFYVVQMSPKGELSSGIEYPSINIQFSKPVVPIEKLGVSAEKSEYVSIKPDIKGFFRWYGTGVLSFECTEPILIQRKYTVTVNPDIESVTGERLKGENTFYFYTEDLKIINAEAGFEAKLQNKEFPENSEIPTEYACDVAVYFSGKIDASVVSKYLSVLDCGSNKELKYILNQNLFNKKANNMLRIKITEPLKDNMDIKILLKKGAKSSADAFPSKEDSVFEYATLKDFSISDETDGSLSGWGEYFYPVKFYFNHNIALESEDEIAKNIKTIPEMPITKDNIKIEENVLSIYNLPVIYNSKYTIEIDTGIYDVYGKRLKEKIIKEINVPEAASYVDYKDYGLLMLEAEFEPNISFAYQNIKAPSSYSIKPLRGVTSSFKLSKEQSFSNFFEKALADTKNIEKISLLPFLEQTEDFAAGAVLFSGKITYSAKVYDWEKEKYKKQDEISKSIQCIQVTDLGITARYGFNKLIVLVTKLSTGEPLSGVQVLPCFMPYDLDYENIINKKGSFTKPILYGEKAQTDEAGLAVINFSKDEFLKKIGFKNNYYSTERNLYIEVSSAHDKAIFTPCSNYVYNKYWNRGEPVQGCMKKQVTFIFTDRGLYRPGESLKFRGIDRDLLDGKYSVFEGGYKLTVKSDNYDSSVYKEFSGKTSASGSFYGEWEIPENLEPGGYELCYERIGSGEFFYCYFQVEYFKNLRFEASVSLPEKNYYSGDKLSASIKAGYLNGGNLGKAEYCASWSRNPVKFTPKSENFKNWDFGPLIGYDGREWLNSKDAVLSAGGKGFVEQKTGGEKLKGTPYYYLAQADIRDAGNQFISANAYTVVHPASFYIGISNIKNINGFPKKEDELKFEYTCLTPDEKIPENDVLPESKNRFLKIELFRKEWKQIQQAGDDGTINTRYKSELITEFTKKMPLHLGKEPSEISVSPKNGGEYILRLSSSDKNGREIITETDFYSVSSDYCCFNSDNAQEIVMTSDKSLYKTGETARILVKSPLPAGRYLMTVEREGIISEKVFTLESSASVIDFPIEEEYIPVVYVTLSSYSKRTGKPSENYEMPDLNKPKDYFGYIQINTDISSRKFDIKITYDKQDYRPNEKAIIFVHAEKNGKPLSNAEITLSATDRGVLDLIDYHIPDPAEFFYNYDLFPDCVLGGGSRAFLIDPVTYEVKNLYGGDSSGKEDGFQERKNFNPSALFVPELITDENGNAQVEFTLPDSLTAYRITAVGALKEDFALAENEIKVFNPVSVHEVLPSMLRVDDKCSLGVVVTNMTDKKQDVKITLNIKNSIEKTDFSSSQEGINKLSGTACVLGDDTKNITVEPNSSLALMFNVQAQKEGWITVEYIVDSKSVKEKIIKTLEIEKPYIYETVTSLGEINNDKKSDSVEEHIVIPYAEKGGITVQLDSSRLGLLKEAVNYVFKYPYGCLEQRSSKILPLAVFEKYISVFGLENEVIYPKTAVKKEIAKWANSQLENGAFPYWPNQKEPDIAVSIRIGEIIAIAKAKGIEITSKINIEKLANYISEQSVKGSYYISSYGQYVLARLTGRVDKNLLKDIVSDKYTSASSLAFCGLAYLESGNKEAAFDAANKIKNCMSLTARGADIQKIGNISCFMQGNAELYAVVLHLFTLLDYKDKYNSHLVYELLQIQKEQNGYWYSSAQTARVLIALSAYIESCSLENTDFKAQALIGNKVFAQGSFKGLNAPLVKVYEDFSSNFVSNIQKDKEIPFVFSKNGNGSLFYTLSMKYDVPVVKQIARDEGISLFTQIIDAETGKLVTEDKLKTGNLYMQKIYISSSKDRNYVALRIPVPAGAEIMNAAFATTGLMPSVNSFEEGINEDFERYEYDDYYQSLSNQVIYNCEVQYFWNNFYKGIESIEFYFRPVREGFYNTPCAYAECMYEPEIFGRTQGKLWKIE